MGGRGSGNYYHWWRPRKKTVVEVCLGIDANRWMPDGVLKAGVRLAGSCRWTYPAGGESSLGYEVRTLDMARPRLFLSYSWKRLDTGQQEPSCAPRSAEH
jgi:hypothetical protein